MKTLIFIFIFLFSSTLLANDVFLLKNAGLSSGDTTLNIPGGSELGSKNLQKRYSKYN